MATIHIEAKVAASRSGCRSVAPGGPEAAAATSGSVAGELRGPRSNNSSVAPKVATSRSVGGTLRGPRSRSCSVWERWMSAMWLQKQQLQRPGALLERSMAPEAAVRGMQRYGSVAETRKYQMQRPEALQERQVTEAAAGVRLTAVVKIGTSFRSSRTPVPKH